VTFAAFTIMAGLAQRSGVWPRAQITTAFAATSAIAVLFLIPPPPAAERDPASLAVMTYNIHHGFNDDGVPGMQRTANEIARLNPDIIAIQEIGRGWTMLGGNDLVGYLRWRFPDYQIDFVALNGQLWGNAIMSRLPVEIAKGETFETAPGVFKYGWMSALINYAGQRLAFYSVHITSDLDGPMGDERVAQVEALQHLTLRNSPLIVAGDFNAHPEDRPMQLFGQMLSDLGAQAGLGEMRTWPAVRSSERIDYIFGRGIMAVSGAVPAITASDHLPVLVRVRLADKPR
jgi:endonuclease/exonuclease/phosphatase family metal-dependent hydrolase